MVARMYAFRVNMYALLTPVIVKHSYSDHAMRLPGFVSPVGV